MLSRMEATRIRMMLARAPGLTAEHARALLDLAGGEAALERALRSGRDLGAALGHVPTAIVRRHAALRYLSAPDESELLSDLSWADSSGARVLLCTDPEYPPQLAHAAGAPPVLFVRGCVAALSSPQLAIVGARHASAWGCRTAREFAAALTHAHLTITSGLAMGIDAASHEGALCADGLTLAVFGTGLDSIYPAANTRLAARILERGAWVSEFPPRTPPLAQNFPRRNRIISGLSLGVLVVEAARRSGSLITGRWAAEQGREVFAIPGSIHNPLARGCHKLIRQGATLVEEVADVLSELQLTPPEQGVTQRAAIARAPSALDKEYEMLLDALGFEPATIDVLATRTGLPSGSIASMLLILELAGCVTALPGGRYDRIT
jgi:DNA processing protein